MERGQYFIKTNVRAIIFKDLLYFLYAGASSHQDAASSPQRGTYA
jgi:hypothetical protein